MMELVNELTKNIADCREELKLYTLERFATLLGPVAPHLAEEVWQVIGKEKSLFEQPVYYDVDEAALAVDNVTIAVQVNGKLRSTIEMPVNSEEADVKANAWQDDKVKAHTDGKTVVKEIYVKNKIYNIVVR